MDLQRGLPERRHPAHPSPVERHNEPIVLQVTVCSRDRKPVLADERMHVALRTIWAEHARAWLTGTYVIMPDHIHLFCVPGEWPIRGIERWVGYWKRLASQQLFRWQPLWLKGCWDTQMRTREQYNEKLHYVRQNPVRKDLVSCAEDWPFAGELHRIRW